MEDEPPLLPPRPDFDVQAPISAEAVRVRARTAQARGEAGLRRMGVRVVRLFPRAVPPPLADVEDPGTSTGARSPGTASTGARSPGSTSSEG